MPREIVLGNQCLLVNIDKWLQIRDLYFPFVGEENHVGGHAHKIGAFVDGKLSWVNTDAWTRDINYDKNTLVSHAEARNEELGVELHLHDCVSCDKNIFLRKISVKNNSDRPRTIKLFFYQDFHLYGTDVGDTAGYDAHRNAIFHYKRNRYFMINAIKEQTCTNCEPKGDFSDFAVGQSEFGHMEGTWRDAEDGVLSGNPIAQGSVDSTVGITVDLQPGEITNTYFWIAAGKSRDEVCELNDYMMMHHPDKIFESTRMCWEGIVNSKQRDFKDLSEEAQELYKRSILIVISQIDKGGAITAANDSDNMKFNRDTYSYCWPRDGALVAIGMDKAGFHEYTKTFFEFCAKVISKHGSMLHKYNPDGSLGSTWHPWVKNGKPHLPIQEDETALVIHALWHFYERSNDKDFCKGLYESLILKAADFMAGHVYKNNLPIESYDLWEEREGILTFTTASVIAGLDAAANFCKLFDDKTKENKYRDVAKKMKTALEEHLWDEQNGRFYRMVNMKDEEIVEREQVPEISTYGVFDFGVLPADHPKVESNMHNLRQNLWVNTRSGGMARYVNDYYHRISADVPGNPWIICTIWLGKWNIAKAKTLEELKEGKEMIDWVVNSSTPSGLLPEQIHPYTGEPLSVSPLTWSHAEYIAIVNNYIEKYTELRK